jgi:chromosomal replication initiator protein
MIFTADSDRDCDVTDTLTHAWQPGRLAERLAQTVEHGRFKSWFQSARFSLHDDELDIQVPNRFAADWIASRCQDEVGHIVRQELGRPIRVKLRADSEPTGAALRPAAEPAPAAPRPPIVPAASDAGRHDLDDFIVGPSNELAYNAVQRLIDEPKSRLNPLFIHGACGLGKTHLLQGLCRRLRLRHPQRRCRYTNAEEFTNEFIAALKGNRLPEFRKKLRQLDLLAIDDVHFLAGKTATQVEFLHTFNAIDLGGANLVIASDAHPKLIKQFSEALISRFMSGMVVQVAAPDAALRQRVLRALAEQRGLRLLDGVIATLAAQATSIRELEGIIVKLAALAQHSRPADQRGEPIGHALAQQALGGAYSAGLHRPVRLEQIVRLVCDHLAVDRAQVMARGRHARIVLARSIIIHLARRLTTLSYPELARELARPNHSTIITAAQRVDDQIRRRLPIPLVESLGVDRLDLLVDLLHQKLCGQAGAAA